MNKIPHYTLAEYLAMEPEGDIRHEYLNGELVAMTGTSVQHNMIVTRLTAALYQHLRGIPCRVVSHAMKVLIATANRAHYPDLVIGCSAIDEMIDSYTETRPRVIIEVLSPSTANTDRYQKRLDYQQLESLQEYVLVEQSEPGVDVYSRQEDGWLHTVFGAGETIKLPSIDWVLPIATVYRD